MSTGQIVFSVLICLAAVIISFKVFKSPLKFWIKLLVNTAAGFFMLVVLDLVSSFTGISLGVSLINAAIIGVLGLPGLGLLMIVQIMF